jgi:exodeoxyribonuclease VII small subunit
METDMNETEKKLSFEEAVKRLDEIVRILEKGEAPIEESLALFGEATLLLKDCGDLLDNAEQKVRLITQGPDGTPSEISFTAEAEA